MSAKLNPASGSDLYATVDLSKKKKNAPHQEESMDSSIYAVVNKKCKGSNTLQATYAKENDNITTQSKRNNENDFDIEGKKFKKRLNAALVLSLVANAAVSIIVVLLVVMFVRTNEQVSYDMAALNSSIEKQLKFLDDNIQHLNAATAVRSSSSFLLHVTNFSYLVEEESSHFLLQAISHSENISQQYLQLLTTISRLYSNSARIELLINSNITSCAALKNLNASSGYYTLPSSTGELTRVYCNMDMTCGNITGGWMRVADLDLYNCPPGLRSQTVQGNKTCIKSEFRGGCTPLPYSTFGISYSKVCGEITGFWMVFSEDQIFKKIILMIIIWMASVYKVALAMFGHLLLEDVQLTAIINLHLLVMIGYVMVSAWEIIVLVPSGILSCVAEGILF